MVLKRKEPIVTKIETEKKSETKNDRQGHAQIHAHQALFMTLASNEPCANGLGLRSEISGAEC